MKQRFGISIGIIAIACVMIHAQRVCVFAQTSEVSPRPMTSPYIPQVRDTIDYKLIRNDDEDFMIFLKPAEVIEWGIGIFSQGKTSVNISNLMTRSSAPSAPSFLFQRYDGENTTTVGVDLRPSFEYGVSMYAPMLANIAGRNIGFNLDAYLATYRFGVQYYLTTILSDNALQRFKAQSGVASSDEYSLNVFPKFFSTYRYINIAPMLNISGFLIGVNIGIPFSQIPSQLSSSVNTVLSLSRLDEIIPADRLRIIVEPRIGIMAPLISTRTGSLNFLATISWMPPTLAPLAEADSLIIRRPNQMMDNAIQSWWANERMRPQNPDGSVASVYKSSAPYHSNFLLSPISITVGLSYMFNFGNASVIEEYERENYRTDSIRGAYSLVNKRVDLLKNRSVDLADSLADGIIMQSKLKDTLAAVEKQYTIEQLKRKQDSIRKSQEREIFAAKEELAITMGIKSSLESQKKDLEKKNKQKDEAIAARNRELKEKQRALEEKQKLLDEAKQRVFEAKLGSVIGMNEDGSEMQENPTLRIEEFSAQSIRPLLPVVFFDQSSSVIPARYKQVQSAARETYKVPDDALKPAYQLHSDMLNIIAKRLQQRPSTKLVLTGIQAPTESDPKVAARRAEAVAAYFINTWKIPSERLLRETKPFSAGLHEGRSVMLSSADSSICAPYILPTVLRSATPPVLTIGLNINAGAGLKQWQLSIRQLVENEDTELKDTTSKIEIPRYSWFVNDEQASMPRSSSPLTIALEATDIANSKAPESPFKEVKVENITLAQKKASNSGQESAHYEVLFSSSFKEFSPESKPIVEEIRRKISSDSRVRVMVYNPRGVSGNIQDVAQALGLDVAKALIRLSPAKRINAQTSEANIFNQSMIIRIDNVAK